MKLKRIISSILAAAEPGSKSYNYDGYQVEYTVQNDI